MGSGSATAGLPSVVRRYGVRQTASPHTHLIDSSFYFFYTKLYRQRHTPKPPAHQPLLTPADTLIPPHYRPQRSHGSTSTYGYAGHGVEQPWSSGAAMEQQLIHSLLRGNSADFSYLCLLISL
jgi:hypothetical protein